MDNSVLQLLETLPNISGDIEGDARAVLRFVLAPFPSEFVKEAVDARTCPNCGEFDSSTKSPYCGGSCRETAGFVRQIRTGLKLGWIFETEKQIALGQNLWDLMGGGRPLRVHIAPERSISTVMKREEGRCQVCGEIATTIDHIGSGCNRPINLRAVCEACCLDRPFGDLSVLADTAVTRLVMDISMRIQSPTALRCCDDADAWNWRTYLDLRRKMLAAEHRSG